MSAAAKFEMRRLNIDETFFEETKTYLIDPDQQVRVTTQQSPIKINDIDIDVFDFKNVVEQQIRQAPVDSLDSERGYDNLLLASNCSIKYTE